MSSQARHCGKNLAGSLLVTWPWHLHSKQSMTVKTDIKKQPNKRTMSDTLSAYNI